MIFSRPRLGLVILAIAACAAAFFVGQATAQNKKYPWLPDEYSEPYTPTLLEWRVMRYNAEIGPSGQSFKRLDMESSVLHVFPGWLLLNVFCTTRYPLTLESFQLLPDREQRAEMSEVAKKCLFFVRSRLDPKRGAFNLPSRIEDDDLTISFRAMDATELGIWRNGKVILPGEPGFE